jgi:hypothetical protein
MNKFRLLEIASEGFQALETARTKFAAIEVDVEELSRIKEKLFQEVVKKLRSF